MQAIERAESGLPRAFEFRDQEPRAALGQGGRNRVQKIASRLAPQLRDLKFLHLGASSSVESLDPVSELPGLEWFQVESPTKCFALEPLQALHDLVGLGFLGVEGKRHRVPSLAPLAGLEKLRWLHLGAVHVDDQSLRPLAPLQQLQWLGLGNFYPVEEFAWLSTRLPRTACDWLQPYCRFHRSVFPCRKCNENWRVMTSGKGSRLLCPRCDSHTLVRHVQMFRLAASEAQRERRADPTTG